MFDELRQRVIQPRESIRGAYLAKKNAIFCEAAMWSLIILVFATSNVASATVTTLEFSTEQLCQMAVRELDNLTKPVVTEGAVRYKVLGACVHTSEVVKK